MASTRTYKTPGVYVAELSSFPPSVVGVQTAVPAFIGYTQRAEVNGKPVQFKPIPITSLAAFEEVFGGADQIYYSIEDVDPVTADNYDFRVFDGSDFKYYRLKTVGPSFNLYNSMRLFYANGGGNCYVVSCGLYTDLAGKTAANPDAMDKALAAAGEQTGPTMLVAPDAVLLAPDAADSPWISTAYGTFIGSMLKQAERLQDRVAVLDVYGTPYLSQPPEGDAAQPTLAQVISEFRTNVGDAGLRYGMGYFPFLQTTVVPASSISYASLDNKTGKLTEILNWENTNLYGTTPRAALVKQDIDTIPKADEPVNVKLSDNLTAALPLLVEMQRTVQLRESLLPPSAAMAGIMTYVDSTRGVWNAPANYSLSAVIKPSYPLNSDQQENLNMPVDGKAVDALREFPGRGTVVWGARTLDGNSNDFRYIQVRRTMIYIEQSIKNALNPFVFAPNTGQTWTSVVSMVSSFLQTLWSQGGLMGATAQEAFSVECGLGSTMTGQDVLNGYMIVQVTLQLIRPAEFIELTFKQKMEGVA